MPLILLLIFHATWTPALASSTPTDFYWPFSISPYLNRLCLQLLAWQCTPLIFAHLLLISSPELKLP